MSNSPIYRATVLATNLLLVSCHAGRVHTEPLNGANASSQGTAEQGECSPSRAQAKAVAPTDEPSASVAASLFERLKKEERLALFCDNHGVYAIDGAGNIDYFIHETFDWITLDYGAGLLWLDRPWSDVAEPGLFVVDLAAAEPALTKLALLQRGTEVKDSGGHVLPMTEGEVPYQIFMNRSPISIAMLPTKRELVCESECEISDEAVALGHVAQVRYGVWTSPLPQLKRLTYPEGEGASLGTILRLPLDNVDLELRAVALAGHPGGHVWQLYDASADEYISPELGIRSKRKLEEGRHIDHLMICEGGRGIVVERGFFGPDLTRLDRGGNSGMGVCLTGGVIFEDRSGLRK